MKSIAGNKRTITFKAPILCLGVIAMWEYVKYGYSVKTIINSAFHGYFRMRNGYKGQNKDKRINQMMLFAKNHLIENN